MDNTQCPIGKRICFNAATLVVVVYNISENIHNNTCVTFVVQDGDDALVKRNGVAVKIKRKTWSSYVAEGRIISRRSQILLERFWATTVTKPQGQELDGMCFHSLYEFTDGQICTVLSQVKKASEVDHKRSLGSHFVQNFPSLSRKYSQGCLGLI